MRRSAAGKEKKFTMADFWDKYREASEATDTVAKLRGLTECITQTEDKVTRRIAAHDLGPALYQGKDGFPQDKEKGKKLMELSAERRPRTLPTALPCRATWWMSPPLRRRAIP